MKRIYRFTELSADQQRAAIRHVAGIAARRAAYCGEVWTETGRELAELAKFTLTKTGEIWNAEFFRYPTVRPGTAFRAAA